MVTNRSAPPGRVVAVLIYGDVLGASGWLCRAFGFREPVRAGDSHVQLEYEGGAVILGASRVGQGRGDDARMGPPRQGEVSSLVHVKVADVDGHHARAKAAGAKIVLELETHVYGERQYTAEDVEGHRWTFSQSVADVAPEAWGGVTGA